MTALLISVGLLYPMSCYASVLVEGPPLWLSHAAERAMEAVWKELEDGPLGREEAVKTLGLVGKRLFSGYDVISLDDRHPQFKLEPLTSPHWNVKITYSNIAHPMDRWLSDDVKPVYIELQKHLVGVPPDALSWGDRDFRDLVDKSIAVHLPGWRASSLVRVRDDSVTLELSISPEPPLILATTPSIYSGTLPNFLRDDLRESLMKDLSPIAGLPVAWIELHKEEVERWASSLMMDRNTVSRSLSRVDVSIEPSLVSKVNAQVESSRYSMRAWLEAYAGVDDKPPKFGLHLGRNVQVFPGWDWELYGELLLELDDFTLQDRWGVKWGLYKNVSCGAEYDNSDSSVWYRLWLEGHDTGPYMWIRYSEKDESEIALGYRINQRVSVELNYDSRDDDRLSIKAIGDL